LDSITNKQVLDYAARVNLDSIELKRPIRVWEDESSAMGGMSNEQDIGDHGEE
jgi:hypothetical protein